MMGIVLVKVGIADGAIVIPDRETTHRRNKDIFIWFADNTVKSFVIDFDGQWPFSGSPTPQNGYHFHPVVLTVTSTATATDYKYSVSVVPTTGPTPPPLDPHIIVDNMVDGGDGVGDDLKTAMSVGEVTFASIVKAL